MNSEQLRKIFFVFLLITHYLSLITAVNAEVLDRVVAIVDDDVIMLSELDEAYQNALNFGMEFTREEVLDGLINQILLLREAEKFKKEHIFAARTTKDNNALINEYIEKRIKTFIHIPLEEIEHFYNENKEFFNEDFYDMRDEIEVYLREKELNKRLLTHMGELRERAYIRIQLNRDE